MNRPLLPVLQAVRHAATLCQSVQTTDVASFEKVGREPVTVADFGSQAILCKMIHDAYPDDAIVAEETTEHFLQLSSAQQTRIAQLVAGELQQDVSITQVAEWLAYGRSGNRDSTWVIDPIDGTKGFLGQRSYTIAVGLLASNQPVAGILGSPGLDDGRLFYAENNRAYESSLTTDDVRPIAVSARTTPTKLVMVESFESGHAAHNLMADIYTELGAVHAEIIRIDGQDKYGLVARGTADIYVRISPKADYREKIWDHAAGVAIIQAAGGIVTDETGKPLDFSAGNQLHNNQSVIVSNGHIHQQLITAIQKIRS